MKASLDDNTPESIRIEKEKWGFMFVPHIFIPGYKKDVCYIALIDKKITLNESIKQQIITILTTISQDDNIEEVPNINNPKSLIIYDTDYLFAAKANTFSRILDLHLKQSIYKSAFVVILTINEVNKKINFKIKKVEQIELNSSVYGMDLIVNNYRNSNRLDILTRLFSSSKHLGHEAENSPQSNNADRDKTPDAGHLLLDDYSNNDDNTIFVQENNFAATVSDGGTPDNTKKPNGKTYTCIVCGEQYNDINVILVHVGLHSKQRPFKCERHGCNKSFTVKGNLKAHENTHCPTQPFSCQECGKSFDRRYNLTVHSVRHSKEELTYECRWCHKKFPSLYFVRKHTKLTHPSLNGHHNPKMGIIVE